MNNSRSNLYMLSFCFYFMLCMVITGNAYPDNVISESNNVNREIIYSFTIQNTKNGLLKKAEFWTYAPVKETSTQRCVNLEVNYPYELSVDDLNNQILYFQFHDIPPFATKVITIKADLILSDTSHQIPEKEPSLFLQAEKYIESDAPEISLLAEKLKGGEPSRTAQNIFHWVAENIQFSGYLRNERGALYALKNKQGDCTEYMDIFVALCRANGIPARGIGGYVCSENTVLKPSAHHNWAEFYHDGVWRIADPQRKVFMENQSHYIAMRVIGESSKDQAGQFHRFRFRGDGLKVKMSE